MTTDRRIECEFKIPAAIDKVWLAITEAEHIRNWFAPHAKSVAGKGGYIDLVWAEPHEPIRLDILEWEGERYLKTTWYAAPRGEEEKLLPLEISLEKTSDGTKLRLVHSGFLSDESWDDEFESHSRGWHTELRHLCYYVEQQFNQTRSFVLERFALNDSPNGISTFLNEKQTGVLPSLIPEGQAFSLKIGNENWPCRLLYQYADKDFVFLCDLPEGGVIRLSVETMTGAPELWFWAFSYGLTEEQLIRKTAPLLRHIKAQLS